MCKISFVLLFLLLSCSQVISKEVITIYAAASTSQVVQELSQIYQVKTGQKVVGVFASSSTLAKQIEKGASADLYLSAHTQWMAYLQKKIPIEKSQNLLQNSLVLITPKHSDIEIKLEKNFPIDTAFKGKIAVGDPLHVPAGIYAKEALLALSWWSLISSRVVRTMDVKGALRFVESGECELGIVYATDAVDSSDVKILKAFPSQLHEPIVYPLALLNANKKVGDFYQFLFSSEAQEVYRKYGFKYFSEQSI